MNFHAASKGHQGNDDLQQLLFTIIVIHNELAIVATLFTAAHDRIRLWFATTTADYNSNPFFHFSKPADPIVADQLTVLTVRAYEYHFYKPTINN